MHRLIETLPFPRLGSTCQWVRRDLIDPETLEVVGCCVLWAYGPIGAFTCSEAMTDSLFPELPEDFKEEVANRCVGEVNHLLGWVRRESFNAGGKATP